jgi:hypothetical protein
MDNHTRNEQGNAIPKVPTIRLVFDFLNGYYKTNGIPPSIIEIAGGVGLKSTNTVQHHIDELVELGYIRRIPKAARGNVPTGKPVTASSFTAAERKRLHRKATPEGYINSDDPYGGLYEHHSASVRRKNKGIETRRED